MEKKVEKEMPRTFQCPVHKLDLVKATVRGIAHKPSLMKFKVCPQCGYVVMFMLKPSLTAIVAGRRVETTVSFG